jgi:hypothetical protein
MYLTLSMPELHAAVCDRWSWQYDHQGRNEPKKNICPNYRQFRISELDTPLLITITRPLNHTTINEMIDHTIKLVQQYQSSALFIANMWLGILLHIRKIPGSILTLEAEWLLWNIATFSSVSWGSSSSFGNIIPLCVIYYRRHLCLSLVAFLQTLQ